MCRVYISFLLPFLYIAARERGRKTKYPPSKAATLIEIDVRRYPTSAFSTGSNPLYLNNSQGIRDKNK